MVRPDYREEVGLRPATKKVPLPVALIILGATAGLVWWGAATMHSVAAIHGAPQPELTVHK